MDRISVILLAGSGLLSLAALATGIGVTPKAVKKKEKAESEKGEPLTKAEIVKLLWKDYIPSAAFEVASLVCLGFAGERYADDICALADQLELKEGTLADLTKAVHENADEETQAKIETAQEENRVKREQEQEEKKTSEAVPDINGPTLFREPWSGRYFWSTKTKIRDGIRGITELVDGNGSADLNDFFVFVDVEESQSGSEIGWSDEDLYGIKGGVGVSFEPIDTLFGVPGYCIIFHVKPHRNFAA